MDFSFLKHAINVWYVSTENNSILFDYCKAALTDKELERVSFFKFKKVQDNYIYSQGTLRLLLSKYLNIPPRELQIGRLKKGKPYSVDSPDLRFNISNSGGKILYCFSNEEELGIDLEKIRPLPDLEDLIERNFNSYEKSYITKIREEKANRFFKFWTIKEAYLKAIGVGMRLTPDKLEFSIEKEDFKLESIQGETETEEWIFKDLDCGENYRGTLVYRNSEMDIIEMSIE